MSATIKIGTAADEASIAQTTARDIDAELTRIRELSIPAKPTANQLRATARSMLRSAIPDVDTKDDRWVLETLNAVAEGPNKPMLWEALYGGW